MGDGDHAARPVGGVQEWYPFKDREKSKVASRSVYAEFRFQCPSGHCSHASRIFLEGDVSNHPRRFKAII